MILCANKYVRDMKLERGLLQGGSQSMEKKIVLKRMML